MMPYISTKTNHALSKEKEESIKAKLGQAIKLFPGKSEQWLMLSFEDNCRLWFQGDNSKPMAFIEIKLFGRGNAESYDKMTAEITTIMGSELSIAPSDIYIKYEEVEHWGWNSRNF